MGLLDTEILSNRFDVENSLNNTMTERAQGYGALDRSVYAPMTASTALQGDMAGQAIGGMLGGRQVEMQKQDIIDDIMQRNPDPKTSAELRSVAGEFAKAGLTDYSFQITEVANQLYKTEVDKNVATDKWYTGTGKSLKNSLLTDDILKAYIYQKENITAKDWNDDDQWTRMDRKDALASARTDLGGQIDNYSNRLMQDGYSKSMLKDLQKNDADFMQHFLTDLSQYGNQDIKDFFQSVMVFDSKEGKNSISISSEYVARLSQDEIDVMDFQSAALLYDTLKDTRKLTKTQREVFKKLETKIKSPNGFELNEVELRNILTTKGTHDAETIEKIIEQHMQRTNQTYKGVGTSASIAPVDDGTMMAMNTQQPDDNFSSWIV
tara:strand:+ start:280 stop:1416 length:1137 start_codon:yes stop_codon:yes gene_type:complete